MVKSILPKNLGDKSYFFAVSTTCNTKTDLETTTNESIHHSDILCMKSFEKSAVSLLLNE